MINGKPPRDADLDALEISIVEAKFKLVESIQTIQDRCNHSAIFEYDSGYGEMRICPTCGREEHTPYYHSFWFKELYKDANRLIINLKNSSDFYLMRLESNHKIFHRGE